MSLGTLVKHTQKQLVFLLSIDFRYHCTLQIRVELFGDCSICQPIRKQRDVLLGSGVLDILIVGEADQYVNAALYSRCYDTDASR